MRSLSLSSERNVKKMTSFGRLRRGFRPGFEETELGLEGVAPSHMAKATTAPRARGDWGATLLRGVLLDADDGRPRRIVPTSPATIALTAITSGPPVIEAGLLMQLLRTEMGLIRNEDAVRGLDALYPMLIMQARLFNCGVSILLVRQA
jgi:hypothetical protein